MFDDADNRFKKTPDTVITLMPSTKFGSSLMSKKRISAIDQPLGYHQASAEAEERPEDSSPFANDNRLHRVLVDATLQTARASFADVPDKERMLAQVVRVEPTYRKGNYDATARIAQNYPTAVKNATIVLQNLLQEGMPGLEDTDERNRWLCTKCKTFSTVQEAIIFLESLQS